MAEKRQITILCQEKLAVRWPIRCSLSSCQQMENQWKLFRSRSWDRRSRL